MESLLAMLKRKPDHKQSSWQLFPNMTFSYWFTLHGYKFIHRLCTLIFTGNWPWPNSTGKRNTPKYLPLVLTWPQRISPFSNKKGATITSLYVWCSTFAWYANLRTWTSIWLGETKDKIFYHIFFILCVWCSMFAWYANLRTWSSTWLDETKDKIF